MMVDPAALTVGRVMLRRSPSAERRKGRSRRIYTPNEGEEDKPQLVSAIGLGSDVTSPYVAALDLISVCVLYKCFQLVPHVRYIPSSSNFSTSRNLKEDRLLDNPSRLDQEES